MLVRRNSRSGIALFKLEVGLAQRVPMPWMSSHLHAYQALDMVMKSTNSLVGSLLVPKRQYVRTGPLTSIVGCLIGIWGC